MMKIPRAFYLYVDSVDRALEFDHETVRSCRVLVSIVYSDSRPGSDFFISDGNFMILDPNLIAKQVGPGQIRCNSKRLRKGTWTCE